MTSTPPPKLSRCWLKEYTPRSSRRGSSKLSSQRLRLLEMPRHLHSLERFRRSVHEHACFAMVVGGGGPLGTRQQVDGLFPGGRPKCGRAIRRIEVAQRTRYLCVPECQPRQGTAA